MKIETERTCDTFPYFISFWMEMFKYFTLRNIERLPLLIKRRDAEVILSYFWIMTQFVKVVLS